MSGAVWRIVAATLLAGLCAAACGTQARWVNCDGRLEPINLPVPKKAAEHASQKSAQVEQPSP